MKPAIERLSPEEEARFVRVMAEIVLKWAEEDIARERELQQQASVPTAESSPASVEPE
jgi:hypothetical protein